MKRLLLSITALATLAPLPAFAQGGGGGGAAQAPPVTLEWNDAIPPGNADHAARALKESPRHGEWVKIPMADGTALNSWVVYPERKDKAGVVLVIHDIGGMRDWPRALGDQLAQDGFIAIVPDFLSGKAPGGGGSAELGSNVGQAIRDLKPDEVTARLNAAMEYGRKLPSANGKVGVVGFCWGGARSFATPRPSRISRPPSSITASCRGRRPTPRPKRTPRRSTRRCSACTAATTTGSTRRYRRRPRR